MNFSYESFIFNVNFFEMNTPLLETERLYLNSITPATIKNLFETKNQQEIQEFFGIDENGFEKYKDMYQNGMETHRISLFVFLLIKKDNNKPIGECGFHTWNRTHNRAEIFYNLYNEEEKRKGFVSEALPIILKYGFEFLNLHRVEGLVDPNNTPSIRLLLKNGFQKEGTMRQDYLVNGQYEDSDCYSLINNR